MELPWFLTNPDPNIYLSNNYLVLDFETTNKDKGDPLNRDNNIVLACWKWGLHGEVHSRWGNEYELLELVQACEKADFILAQNAKFELGWLQRCGLDISKVLCYDTMLGAYVQDGNRRKPRDLDSLAGRYSIRPKDSFVKILINASICPSEIPRGLLKKYCISDVLITEQVFLRQREELSQNNLLPVVYTRCLFTPVLADIEKNGLQLDEERVNVEYSKDAKRYKELEAELFELTGGINPNSPGQVAEFLYDRLGFSECKNRRGDPIRTATGKRSASAETIANLTPRNKSQRRFLDLKKEQAKLNANLTKALAKFKDACDIDGGILYAKFNQAIARTHRLTSAGKKHNAQFQNLNRAYKPLFKAKNPGWYIGEIDGAQLEFRTAAYLGQDSRATEDIKRGYDVHSFTASVIRCSRQEAKSRTFKPLYGGSSGTPLERAYYERFKEKYKDIANVQREWIDEVLHNKKLITKSGLIFYWPDTRVTASGFVTNTTSICNYPVQSLATAEIIPIAVVYQWHRLKLAKARSYIVNTVHDSSIGEVHPDEIEMYKDIGFTAFTQDVYFYLNEVYHIDFNVPLGAEYVVAPHWNDKQEIIYEEKI